MSENTTVALVGHCGPDAFMLRSAISRMIPGSSVISIESPSELEDSAGKAHVLLVNRVLDGGFRRASGVDLIRQHAARKDLAPMLLISNFEDAQQEAEAAGALPGFGKQELYDKQSRERLVHAVDLGVTQSAAQ